MKSFDKLLAHEIDTANDHLPAVRTPLEEILDSGDYVYKTRGGDNSAFRKEEIDELATLVPKEFHSRVRLPLVILRRMDLGTGMFTVSGGKVELFLVCGIIDRLDTIEWTELVSWQPIERFVRLQIQILRRRFPSTTTIGFTLTPADE